jgi:CBS domain-containing protein
MLLQDLFRDREEVVTVSPDDTVAHAAMRMKEEDVGAVVVLENERVVGILTDRDVALCTALDNVPADSPVRAVMTKNVRTIWGDEGIFNATQYCQ